MLLVIVGWMGWPQRERERERDIYIYIYQFVIGADVGFRQILDGI
jgi:hypothetical protein